MSAVFDRRRAKMPALKPSIEAMTEDWMPLKVPRAVNVAALARSIFAEQRRRDSAWAVSARAPAHMMLASDSVLLRALLVELIVPAWRALAHYGGGRIEVGEVVSGASKIYFVHDEAGLSPTVAPPCIQFVRERAEALERAARVVHCWGGRFSGMGRLGRGYTVLFTGPRAS